MSAHLTVHFANVSAGQLAAVSGLTPLAAAQGDATAQACALFGLHGTDLPVAALTYSHDFGAPPPAWCARLDPVCLMPSGATLRLIDLSPTPLSESDALDLFSLVSAAGVIAGVQWRLGAPQRWYVLAPDAPDVLTWPPTDLPDGDVAAGQPRGSDAPHWQGWLNELQMLLFDAGPNLAREARDLPPANGLWLWGCGGAPTLSPSPFDTVWTDQPLIGGLARLAGRAPQPVPESPTDWLAGLPAGHGLLGLGSHDATADRAPQWLSALQAALDNRQVQGVSVLAGGARFELRRRGLLARLRRGLPRAAWR